MVDQATNFPAPVEQVLTDDEGWFTLAPLDAGQLPARGSPERVRDPLRERRRGLGGASGARHDHRARRGRDRRGHGARRGGQAHRRRARRRPEGHGPAVLRCRHARARRRRHRRPAARTRSTR